MDDKLIKLVEIVRAEGQIAPADLANRLGVSVRTVRTYVNRVNSLLSELDDDVAGDGVAAAGRIEARSQSVYSLEGADDAKLDALLGKDVEKKASGNNRLPETTEERVAYLMNDLLYRCRWIAIDDLAQMLFVSRATVSENLKEVERRLKRFDLSIERRPRYGIRVQGSELKRRMCLATLAVNSSLSAAASSPFTARDVIDGINDCLGEALERMQLQIAAAARQSLLVHIAVAMARIREGCYVPMEGEQLERIKSTREFSVAVDLAGRLERRFNVRLPESEVAYIAIHLAGRQSLYFPSDARENELVISDEVWDMVGRMVERVWDVYRFDFREDLELRMNLARHVTPLAVRLRYHMRIENPLLPDIKHRYPLAWAMALESSTVLADAYEAQPTEEEIGYLALAFELALEHQTGEGARKNILVVCASGAGAARLLEQRYRREFGSHLNRIETCDVASIDKVDFSDIDYVFTTVPLSRRLPVPVREVGFFLDEGDIKRVREALEAPACQEGVGSYFDERLFIAHFDVVDKHAAIDRLCELVAKHRSVPDNFAELVWDREVMAPTTFGNRVCMPHPSAPCTPDTFVAVALLENPIPWSSDVMVQAIFLVSVSMSTDKDLQGFYDAMSRLLTSHEGIERLIDRRDFGTLLELLDC